MSKIPLGLSHVVIVFLIFVIASSAVAETMFHYDDVTLIEKKLGNSESAAFIQNVVLINAPDLERGLQNMADKLVAETGHELHVRVHIVNQPTIGAFILTSGDIFIFSGLLDRLENRDQLAFVLGHEIAHLVHHDGVNKLTDFMEKQQTMENILTIIIPIMAGATSGVCSSIVPVATITDSTGTMFSRELAQQAASSLGGLLGAQLPIMMAKHVLITMIGDYSQEAELRADRYGVEYAKAAGYDAKRGAEKVFAILREEEDQIKKENLKK